MINELETWGQRLTYFKYKTINNYKMNKILCLLLFVIIGCRPDDQPKPAPVATLPTFSCGDSTDDGKFEQWTADEMKLLAKYDHATFPDHEIAGYLQWIGLSKSTAFFGDTVVVKYVLSKPVSGLTIGVTNQSMSKCPLFPGGSTTPVNDTAIVGFIVNSNNVDPGCSRIYYRFYDYNAAHTEYNVVTKGHLDIQIIQ